MKKNKISTVLTLSIAIALGFTSCEKPDLTTQAANEVTNDAAAKENQNLAQKPLFDAGIRSNQGYPSNGQTNRGYYRMYFNTAPIQLPDYSLPFGGTADATDPNGIKGYGTAVAIPGNMSSVIEVYAYKSDGVIYINKNNQDIPVLDATGTNLFTGAIEEIEIDPVSLDVFALCKVGNAIRLFRLHDDGGIYLATLIYYGTSPNIFHNPNFNGYKSGSITFIPNNQGGYYLAFTNESTVYASLGIGVWVYDYTSTYNVLAIKSLSNRTFSTATSGIPYTTAKINTCYYDNKFYIARDASNLYSYSVSGDGQLGSGTNSPATQETQTALTNKNDFGFFRNY